MNPRLDITGLLTIEQYNKEESMNCYNPLSTLDRTCNKVLVKLDRATPRAR